jgi:hypothetical protein
VERLDLEAKGSSTKHEHDKIHYSKASSPTAHASVNIWKERDIRWLSRDFFPALSGGINQGSSPVP